MPSVEQLRDVLLSVWDVEADDEPWHRTVVECADVLFRSLGADLGTMTWRFRFADDKLVLEPGVRHQVAIATSDDEAIASIEAVPNLDHLAAYYSGAPWSGLMADALDHTGNRDHVRASVAEMGVIDSIGLLCGDAMGGLQLQTISSSPLTLSDKQRWALAGVTAHLSAAIRLRRHGAAHREPDQADAVLSADGGLLDAGAGEIAQLRERLRSFVLGQREVRDAKVLGELESLDSWTSLVDGRYSIVDHFEERGRRLFLLFENPFFFKSPRALSPRQRDVVALAARGQDNRTIGLTLGLAASTVATHLASAMTKLGFADRTELVRYLDWEASVVLEHDVTPTDEVRALEVARLGVVDLSALTDAERDVAEKAALGASNGEIAAARGSRPRTVANQLASAYSKLGVNSRFELAARLRVAT